MNKYFKNPILFDYIIALIVCIVLFVANYKNFFCLPKTERSLSITSDLANVGLTSAGFILTLLTVLITFKSSNKINKNNYSENDSLFDLFFNSSLYFTTIKILKNAIKSLIFISVFGYILKLITPTEYLKYVFFYDVLGLIIISLTLYRCLLILTKVLKMQE